MVLAAAAGALPDLRDRPGADDGDVREPRYRLAVPAQARDGDCWPRSAGPRAGCCCSTSRCAWATSRSAVSSHQLAVGTWQVGLFWFEIAAMAVVPLVLLLIPRVRQTRGGQWAAASIAAARRSAEPGRRRRAWHTWAGAAPSTSRLDRDRHQRRRRRGRRGSRSSSCWSASGSGKSGRPIRRPTRSGCRSSTRSGRPGWASGRGRPHRVLAGLPRRRFSRLRLPVAGAGAGPWRVTRAGPPRAGRRRAVDRRQPRRLRRRLSAPARWRSVLGGTASCVKCHHMNLPRDQELRLLRVPSRYVPQPPTPSVTTGMPRRPAGAWPASSAIARGRHAAQRTPRGARAATRTSCPRARR